MSFDKKTHPQVRKVFWQMMFYHQNGIFKHTKASGMSKTKWESLIKVLWLRGLLRKGVGDEYVLTPDAYILAKKQHELNYVPKYTQMWNGKTNLGPEYGR